MRIELHPVCLMSKIEAFVFQNDWKDYIDVNSKSELIREYYAMSELQAKLLKKSKEWTKLYSAYRNCHSFIKKLKKGSYG